MMVMMMVIIVEFSCLSGFFWHCSDWRDEKPAVNDTTEMRHWPLYHYTLHSRPVCIRCFVTCSWSSLSLQEIRPLCCFSFGGWARFPNVI